VGDSLSTSVPQRGCGDALKRMIHLLREADDIVDLARQGTSSSTIGAFNHHSMYSSAHLHFTPSRSRRIDASSARMSLVSPRTILGTYLRIMARGRALSTECAICTKSASPQFPMVSLLQVPLPASHPHLALMCCTRTIRSWQRRNTATNFSKTARNLQSRFECGAPPELGAVPQVCTR
jgi:hypothetical protein